MKTEQRLSKSWISMERKWSWKYIWATTQRQDLLPCLAWGECWSTQGRMWHYLHTPHCTAKRLPSGCRSPVSTPPTRALFSCKPVRLPSFSRERVLEHSPLQRHFHLKIRDILCCGLYPLCNGNGLMIWQVFSVFNFFDKQNTNLTELDFLLIIFHSTNFYLGTPAWCMPLS